MDKHFIPHIQMSGACKPSKRNVAYEDYALSDKKGNLLSEALWAKGILEPAFG